MNQYQVSFTDAVKRAFNQYCCFTGRASRSEYWWWVLFTFIVGAVLEALAGNSMTSIFMWLAYLFSLATILPSLGLVFRRLHDTGRSGWNICWAFLPLIGCIILIVFLCQPSKPEANQYGPMPNAIL